MNKLKSFKAFTSQQTYQNFFVGFGKKKNTIKESYLIEELDGNDEYNTHEHLHNEHKKVNLTDDQHETVKDYTRNSSHVNTHLYTGEKHEPPDDSVNGESWKERHGNIKSYLYHMDAAINKYKLTKPETFHSGVKFNPARLHSGNEHDDHYKVHLPAYTSTSIAKSTARDFSGPDNSHNHPDDHHYTIMHGSIRTRPSESRFIPVAKEHAQKYNELIKGGPSKELENYKTDVLAKHYPKAVGKYEWQNADSPPSFSGIFKYNNMISIHAPIGSRGIYSQPISHHKSEHEYILPRNSKLHIDKTPTIDHDRVTVQWHAKLVHDGVDSFEDK